MRIQFAVVAVMGAAVACFAAADPARAQDGRPRPAVAPAGPLNTLNDIRDALRGCWEWPPEEDIQTGMELTIMLSFKRSGEIFGARITYQSRFVSDEERKLYHAALAQFLRLCSPLPVSESLGHAIAGRPMTFKINDTRKQRKA